MVSLSTSIIITSVMFIFNSKCFCSSKAHQCNLTTIEATNVWIIKPVGVSKTDLSNLNNKQLAIFALASFSPF